MGQLEDDEAQMREAGFDLDKIPREKHDQHIWSNGFVLFWRRHNRLPTPHELAVEMFDEWDDPVSIDEAQEVIECLTATK